MNRALVEATYIQLCALQTIRPSEKLAVSSAGELTIEEPYMLRSVMRRIRMDGHHASVPVLHGLCVNVLGVCLLMERQQPPPDSSPQKWAVVCENVCESLQTLSQTYHSEGNQQSGFAIGLMSMLVRDCARRFLELSLKRDTDRTRYTLTLETLPPVSVPDPSFTDMTLIPIRRPPSYYKRVLG